jgi:hypothetical protein
VRVSLALFADDTAIMGVKSEIENGVRAVKEVTNQ